MKNKEKLIIQTEDRLQMWNIRMLRLASSAIRWVGLPNTIDTVYLEYCLARSGRAIIVWDEEVGEWFCGQDASVGELDIYGYPMQRSIVFRNGRQMWFTPETSVIIYNNSMRTGDYWIYNIFANDLANMDMAVRINMNTQKTMPIIPTSQQQALSVTNLMNDIQENAPWKLVDEQSIDVEKFKSALMFDNRKSFTSDNIITVQREYWNRVLTFIGVNNVNVEKKERVNVFETNSNLDEIAIMRRDRLNARDMACIQMERLWGLKVKAEYWSDIRNGIGGDGNGNVYDASQDNSRTVLS